MGIKVKGLVDHELRYPTPQGDIVVSYRKPTVAVLDKIRQRLAEAGKTNSEELTDTVEYSLVPLLVSWNLENDDGTPLEITTENVLTLLPSDLAIDLLNGIRQKHNPDPDAPFVPAPS